ncbi:Bug family tripartite tricarboxylate transporter substrate binding protein [Pseudoroseomonas globiformis]|uniref:Bug family tripartite tricarboxylate transporter substrate binding protein n=1 Tax=Teichococcus globiformis TaxID=2307229 RepID=A0ABV7G1Z2_9PROT
MTHWSRRTLLTSAMAIAAGPAALGQAPGRTTPWPSRPLRLVVPFAAGTTTDILGRILADALAREAGQAGVVDNLAGTGGNVGSQAVAQAPGDGYTLLLATNGTHGINASCWHSGAAGR